MSIQHITTDCINVYVKHIDNDEVYYVLSEQRNKKFKERIIGKKSSGITPKEAYDKYQEKLFKTERHKTSCRGVFWRNSTTNGKKDKTYYIVYNDESGKVVESKVGKESGGVKVKYAHQKYLESVNNIKHGEQPPIKRKRRNIFTFDDAFNSYIKYAKAHKKSWNKDEQLYRIHLEEFHQLELVSLKKVDFNTLKIEKLKKYSARTVQYILAVARQIINYAIDNELVSNYSNPISGNVQVKKVSNSNSGFFTKEQAKLLLEALEEHKHSVTQVYPLTVLLLHTGARFSEVASLTWDDINFKEKTIYFKPTKEGNERWISMSALVEEILLSCKRSKGLVLLSSKGEQIKQMPNLFQDIVDDIFPENVITVRRYKDKEIIELSEKDKALLKAQMKKRLTTHSLRHTHASWMAMSGKFNLMEIRDQLGHKTTTMTERYAHLLPKDRHKKTSQLFDNM